MVEVVASEDLATETLAADPATAELDLGWGAPRPG